MKLRIFKKKNVRESSNLKVLDSSSRTERLDASLRSCDETTTMASGDSSGAPIPSAAEALARKCKWEAFVSLVKDSEADDWNTARTSASLLSKEDTSSSTSNSSLTHIRENTTTPLHILLSHRPTVDAVDSTIAVLKEKFNMDVPEEFKDEMGRTPLHVAVENHCTEDIVERLLTGDNLLMPAVMRDNWDRTPLHVAASAPIVKPAKKKLFGPDQASIDTWNKRRTIFVLLEHYPEAATLTDAHGKTALDYARENKLSQSSISRLEHFLAEYGPEEASDFSVSGGELPADTDVPQVFPSHSRNSSGFFPEWSFENIPDAELPADAKDGDDVSTIGYNEAEMFGVDSFDE